MDTIETLELSPQQTQAIAALLTTPNTERAAEVSGVSRSTIYRWLKDKVFAQALRQAEAEAISGVSRYMVNLTSEALEVVISVWREETNPALVRLKAASVWLDTMLRVRAHADLEDRLIQLEAAIQEQRKEDE